MAKDMLDAIYNAKELEKASEKANLECDILSRTADKNRKRVIDGAIQRLSL